MRLHCSSFMSQRFVYIPICWSYTFGTCYRLITRSQFLRSAFILTANEQFLKKLLLWQRIVMQSARQCDKSICMIIHFQYKQLGNHPWTDWISVRPYIGLIPHDHDTDKKSTGQKHQVSRTLLKYKCVTSITISIFFLLTPGGFFGIRYTYIFCILFVFFVWSHISFIY